MQLTRSCWFVWIGVFAAGCGSSTSTTSLSPSLVEINSPSFPAPAISETQAMYAKFSNGVQVVVGDERTTVRTKGIPNHLSPYFDTGHPLYEAPHAGMQINPNAIIEQNNVFEIPTIPGYANPSDTSLGPMGVAVNGVPLFNQYAAMRQPLTFEIESFDRFNGHPAPRGEYHYHLEPLWLTQASRASLIGVLLDGFPVYGPDDASGQIPANLDVCHGHVAVTTDFPSGIYHYHAADDPPYIAGCFRGVPGTIRN